MGNRLFMAASIFIRMGINLGIFVILARTLGPVDFGFVSAVFIYAGLAGLLTDFGFSIRTLRDIAADPDEGGSILAAALTVKGILTTLVMACGLVALWLAPLTSTMRIAAALFGAGILIGSFGDLTLVAYRSLGRFSGETWIVIWTSAIYAAIILPTAYFHLGLMPIGVGFLASRLIYVAVALAGAQRLFPHHRLRFSNARTVLLSIRQSIFWAVDSGLIYVNGQLDGLVIVQILGLGPAGIYLAGARFVQAAISTIAVLSNIHIPSLAATQKSGTISSGEWRMVGEFLALGALIALGFLFGGPLITRFLLGSRYLEVNELWPGFAGFVLARFMAGALGASLAVLGKPILRVAGQLITLAAITIGFLVLLPRFGIAMAPWIMAIGGVVQTVIFAIARLAFLRSATPSTLPSSDEALSKQIPAVAKLNHPSPSP